jgi:serine/threonine-protein kinase
MYEKAVKLDPNFALAWSLISQANLSMYWFHYDHSKERLATAKTAIDNSLSINPQLPEGNYSLGLYYYWGLLDYENALKEFEKAKKLKPNDDQVYLSIGAVYRRQGKMELASTNMERAFKLNPRSRENAFNTAQSFELMRDYEKSDYYYKKGIELSPDLLGSYLGRALQFVRWEGNTQKAREILNSAPKQSDSRSHTDIRGVWIYLEIFDENYNVAIKILSDASFNGIDNQFFFEPKELFYARVNGLLGNKEMEQVYYDSLRVLLENRIKQQPDDPRFHSALGIAFAGLGRKQDAIREGKKGVDLMPVSKEAWRGTFRVKDMAAIHVMVGEYDKAIDQLDYLLSIPSELTVNWLMIDPIWQPLYSLPKFQKMAAKYSRETS